MKNNIFKFTSALIFMLVSFPLLADDDGTEPSEPGAPIDNWLFLLIFSGFIVAAFFMCKQTKRTISELE